MPKHKAHRFFSNMILGVDDPRVHDAMDFPARYLGKRHRIVLHDPLQVAIMSGFDPKKMAVANLHILVDRTFNTKEKKKWLKLLGLE